MNIAGLLALAPLLVLAVSTVVVMLMAAFFRHHGAVMWATLAGLLLALASLAIAAPQAPLQVTQLLQVDGYGLFFSGLVLAATAAIAALAHGYLAGRNGAAEEFYILLLVACLGGLVLASSRHFATFFLGLELLSVPLFALIAYPGGKWFPLEAGIKYLILAGFASAFLLFGMAMVYSETGSLEFIALHTGGLYSLAGMALILVGVGFKLSLVPFHMWVADVYQGAPAPVGAFLATVSKGAVFVLLMRYLLESGTSGDAPLIWPLSLLAAFSMLAGNLLALLQDDLKRVLGYSSVAHMGYLMVVPAAGGELAIEATGYYLVMYFTTMIAAFGVITLLSCRGQPGAERDICGPAEYQGLLWRHPWLAGVLILSLLSLAGIPVTMGFVAKFYVLAVGVDQAQWLLTSSLVVASAIGFYYYLRIIISLFRSPADAASTPNHTAGWPLGARIVVLGMSLLLLLLGIYPAPLINLLHDGALMPG